MRNLAVVTRWLFSSLEVRVNDTCTGDAANEGWRFGKRNVSRGMGKSSAGCVLCMPPAAWPGERGSQGAVAASPGRDPPAVWTVPQLWPPPALPWFPWKNSKGQPGLTHQRPGLTASQKSQPISVHLRPHHILSDPRTQTPQYWHTF